MFNQADITQISKSGRSSHPASAFRFIMAMAAASLFGCAPQASLSCSPGTGSPMTIFTLYFGRSAAGRADVSDAEWQTFLATTITANLPNGYTVFDATGAWMDPRTHRTVEEGTKVLVVAMPEAAESLVSVNRVRAAYQSEFRQQTVGITAEPACGDFGS